MKTVKQLKQSEFFHCTSVHSFILSLKLVLKPVWELEIHISSHTLMAARELPFSLKTDNFLSLPTSSFISFFFFFLDETKMYH